MRSARLVAFSALLSFATPHLAIASAIYQYTGNPFQDVVGRYTTSDSLSGTITLAAPLASNLSNSVVAPVDWSFSDGLKVFTPSNSTADPFFFSTNSAAQIVSWSVDLSGGAAVGVMGTFDNGPIDQIDQATDFTGQNSLASNTGRPRKWTVVPEPSPGALFSLGLSLLAARFRS